MDESPYAIYIIPVIIVGVLMWIISIWFIYYLARKAVHHGLRDYAHEEAIKRGEKNQSAAIANQPRPSQTSKGAVDALRGLK